MADLSGKSSHSNSLRPETGANPAATEESAEVPRSATNRQGAGGERPDAPAAADGSNVGAITFERVDGRCVRLPSKMQHISFDLAFAPDIRSVAIADLLYAVLGLSVTKHRHKSTP